MLKLILPLTLLLLLPSQTRNKFKWSSSTLSLMILSISLIALIPTNNFDQQTLSMSNLDLMSVALVILTLWITALMYMSSFKIIINENKPSAFHINLISLTLVLIVAFSTSNLFLFYIMFEASLIPTLLLILGWGYQPERLQAGNYLIMYTVTASLPLLASLLYINYSIGHMALTSPFWPLFNLSTSASTMWWLITILAFLVKTPMYLTHLWLPKAHVEAPVAGSMVLAGMLLKLGTYGLMRISQFYMPLNLMVSPIISTISLIGATLAGIICMRQTDIKSLIAYSSVSHMGLVTAGIMSGSAWGWYGALTMMLAHGLCSSCMFSLANMTYETVGSRSMYITKGILMLFPTMAMWWFLLSACNMAAPPSINLMGEIMLITSIISSSHTSLIMLAPISFIAAAYSLFLYTSANHGPCLSFSSPLSLLTPRNYSICLLHLTPLILLISSPSFISLFI